MAKRSSEFGPTANWSWAVLVGFVLRPTAGKGLVAALGPSAFRDCPSGRVDDLRKDKSVRLLKRSLVGLRGGNHPEERESYRSEEKIIIVVPLQS